jgi:hypothetical protein
MNVTSNNNGLLNAGCDDPHRVEWDLEEARLRATTSAHALLNALSWMPYRVDAIRAIHTLAALQDAADDPASPHIYPRVDPEAEADLDRLASLRTWLAYGPADDAKSVRAHGRSRGRV